jgi:glucose/arabinose dehydrogenase
MSLRLSGLALLVAGLAGFGCGSAETPSEAPAEPQIQLVGTADVVHLPDYTPATGAPKERKIVGWPEGGMPTAPAGFRVTQFADGFKLARWLYVLPNGDVLASEVGEGEREALKGQGKVWLLRDADNDGVAEMKQQFVGNLDRPVGMTLIGNNFYVADTGSLMRYNYREGQTRATGGTKVLDLIPDGTKIYISVGSTADWLDEAPDALPAERATIWEVNPDGSGKRVYASGVRNAVGMDFPPGSNTLWVVINERALLGDDLPPDYFTSIQDGGFYGWPYSYWGKIEDPRSMVKAPDLVAASITPDYATDPHAAPMGLAFYDGESFPQQYHGGAFIAFHGSSGRTGFVGYDVSYIAFQNGQPTGMPQPFLTGFIGNEAAGEVYGRPMGLAIGADGSLLVMDDAAGRIWKVTYMGQ